MTRHPDDIRSAIDTTLSGASHDPTLFNRVVNASKGDAPPVKKKLTLSMAVALMLALLTGTAFAAAAYHGVTWFLTERTLQPIEINPDLLSNDLHPQTTSEWLDISAQDAYWDGHTLSISLRITAKDPDIAFAMLYDIGLDGETFDMIWLSDGEHSNRMLVEEWLNGRTGILLQDPTVAFRINKQTYTPAASLDYIHDVEENAVILMLQIPVDDMSGGIEVTVYLNSAKMYPGDPEGAADNRLYYRTPGESEFADLDLSIPPMERPFPEHTCEYTPATCQSGQVFCTICGHAKWMRVDHDFQPVSSGDDLVCTMCGMILPYE